MRAHRYPHPNKHGKYQWTAANRRKLVRLIDEMGGNGMQAAERAGDLLCLSAKTIQRLYWESVRVTKINDPFPWDQYRRFVSRAWDGRR